MRGAKKIFALYGGKPRRIVENTVAAITHIHHQLRPEPNDGVRIFTKQLPMQGRKLKPRRGGLGMMGIVIAKVEDQPIYPFLAPRENGAESMLLLPFQIAFVLRDFIGVEIGAVGIVVLETVDKPQNDNHEHVGDEVAH